MSNGIPGRRTAGVILVGTHPWTNSAFDRLMPRTLLPIAHRPLISYALSWMHRAGLHDVIVCGNRETQTLRKVLGRHAPRGMNVRYQEDAMPRGAGGSLRDAIASSDADTFIVTDGTVIPNVDVAELLRTHQQSMAAVTVVVHTEARRHGNPGLQVPTGVYVFERESVAAVPERGFCDIKEKLLTQLYRDGLHIATFEAGAPSPRVLNESTYLAVNEWVIEQLASGGTVPEGYQLHGNALVHREASVAHDAVIVGPVVVAAGAQIRSQAVIVGPSSIGRDAIIEAGAFVSRSAIWRRSIVGTGASADRCVVGDDAVVGAQLRAHQSVVVELNADRTAPTRQHNMPAGVPNMPTLELARKVGRALTGAEWSRSPAAP
jgi:mannose-1-phosphate guanylyltransferase